MTRLATYVVAVTENKMSQSFSWHLGHAWISCNRDYQILTPDGWLLDLATGLKTKIFGRGMDVEGTDDVSR